MTTEFNDVFSASLRDGKDNAETRATTRVPFYSRMSGLSPSAGGYLRGLISDTPFHTEHASFLQQSMGHRERQLNLLDVNMTHSVPGNTCR